jgi:LuxR family maltose regulon positive regulatory protein
MSGVVSDGVALLPSKLTPPTARPRRVIRPRLVRRVEDGLEGRLILIAAPAGFGKTTLLTEWLTSSDRVGVAWVALDSGDNDPARFWSYVIAALQSARPSLTDLPRVAEAPLAVLVHDVVRQLTRADESLVLILDDYHTIESDAVHTGLAFFLEHVPPSLRVVLSTRTDPPLPLARLRARAQLAELRASDLRFTPTETAAFLGDVMGLQLSVDQLHALDARTEGWVAGLQLAALSLQNRVDAQGQAAFVVAFSGSHRFVLDYLMDEVLQQQPDDVQAFLLQTSILERLCSPLCEVVTGESRSAALLEALERRNVFIVPLDDERTWYRYHHLFSEALRHRLVQKSPERVPELHRRAADWYAAHGFELLAVDHALAARDWASAAQLIDQTIGILHARGERETIRRWLEQIPAEAQRQYPLLLVSAGRDWLHAGEFERAAVAVGEAGRLATDLQQMDVLARALLLEANLANQRGDPARTVACAQLAQGLLPEDDVRGHASLTILLASGSLARGDLIGAEQAMSLARLPLDQPAVDWLLRTDRGLLHALRGQLPRAARLHEALLLEIGDLPVVYAVEQRWRLSVLHVEWNDLEQAERYLSEALADITRCHAEVFRARIELTRARLLVAQGDSEAAAVALDQAEAAANRVGNLLHARWAEAGRARLRLLHGDRARAEAWADGVRGDVSLLEPERIVEALVVARIDYARGALDEANRMLRRLLQRAVDAGHEWNAIGTLVLHSLVAEARGEREEATASLRSALQRGAPGDFRRVFLDEGSALVPILRRLRSAAIPLAGELIDALDEGSLSSPISAREREVLVLVAAGMSNREIADKLIVAPNTVKAHVRHLGTKLGASSRTQLLARAREAGLL